MKRSSANRFSALVAALLLLFGWTGDAVGLHPCPHHSAVTAADAGHGDSHAAHNASAENAPDAADHGRHGGCTCVGCCPAGVALPVFGASSSSTQAILPPGTVALADRGTGLPDRFPPFVLPYGHAPPALRA
ncbi:MAG: hypothetical protein AB1941_09685 [Gemmatimonadota bacterium]